LVYNLAHEQRATFGRTHREINCYTQKNELPALKQEFPFLRQVNSQSLQAALDDLDTAFKRFFKGLSGFPNRRKKGKNDSFRVPQHFKLGKHPEPGMTWLFIPKLKQPVATRMHRAIDDGSALKLATIARDGTHWYVSILVEYEREEPTDTLDSLTVLNDGTIVDRCGETLRSLAIDLGIAQTITLSDGSVIQLPRMSDSEWRRLRRLGKRLARCQRGSRNRKKVRRNLQAFHAKIRRRRKNEIRKAAARLRRSCDLLILEELQVKNMVRSAAGTVDEPGRNVAGKRGLNRSMHDASFGMIRSEIEIKYLTTNGIVIAVPPQYTSRKCSCCGYISSDNRTSQARFKCVVCGHEANADVNAARNILTLGLDKIRAEGHSAPACGDSGVIRSMKQETRNREILKAVA